MKKKASKNTLEDVPPISETYYKVVEKKAYQEIPKKRYKAVMLVEDNKTKERFIRIIDKWTKYRFTGPGTGEHSWDNGSSINIKQGDDLNMITKLLRYFGRLLGMKTDEPSEMLLEKRENELKEMNQMLAQRTLEVEQLREDVMRKNKELELAKQVIGDINAFSAALTALKTEIQTSKKDDSRREKEVKKLIYEHKWVLGLDCQVKAKEKLIDTQSALDLHIKTELGEDKIFEFKSPNFLPFNKRKEDNRLQINPELSEGINQLIEYLTKTDLYSDIEQPGTYKIKKPSGVVVIGFNLPKEQESLLKNWNFHLRPHIKLVTYNDLIESASQTLEHIKCVQKKE